MTGSACPWPECGALLPLNATYCWRCRRYVAEYSPDAPAAAPVKRDDPRSEKEIQHAIKGALRAMGFLCWDTSQPHAAKITPGVPDLIVVGRGIVAFVECKSARGKQSEAQADFERNVVANGGLYLLARDEQQVVEWLTAQAAA